MSGRNRSGRGRKLHTVSIIAWSVLLLAVAMTVTKHPDRLRGDRGFATWGTIVIGLIIVALDTRALLESPR